MAREVMPGLYHWTAFHPGIGTRVSSYYVASCAAVVDPKRPERGWDSLPGEVHKIVLTSGHHLRDSGELSERLSIPVIGSQAAADHIGDAFDVHVVAAGQQPAAGITAIHIGALSEDEGALHIAVPEGAVAFADGLISSNGSIGFVPDGLMGDDPEEVKRGLLRGFQGLLERAFDHLLFAHGDPIIGGGKAALEEFVSAPRAA